MKVGLHQGSVLSPLLFIIVLEALSMEFRTGCPWELLYADDLVIVSDDLADLQQRFGAWKSGMEAKGLRVNVGKTKFMTSGSGLNPLFNSDKHPCRVSRQGVGFNSMPRVSRQGVGFNSIYAKGASTGCTGGNVPAN